MENTKTLWSSSLKIKPSEILQGPHLREFSLAAESRQAVVFLLPCLHTEDLVKHFLHPLTYKSSLSYQRAELKMC